MTVQTPAMMLHLQRVALRLVLYFSTAVVILRKTSGRSLSCCFDNKTVPYNIMHFCNEDSLVPVYKIGLK